MKCDVRSPFTEAPPACKPDRPMKNKMVRSSSSSSNFLAFFLAADGVSCHIKPTEQNKQHNAPHNPTRARTHEPSRCPSPQFPVTPRRCDASAKEPVPSSPRAIASPSTPRGSSARRTRRFGPPRTRVKNHSHTPPVSAVSSPVRDDDDARDV